MTGNYICPKCKTEVAFGDRKCAACGTAFWYPSKLEGEQASSAHLQGKAPPQQQDVTLSQFQQQNTLMPDQPQGNRNQKLDSPPQKAEKRRFLIRAIVLSFIAGVFIGSGIAWAVLNGLSAAHVSTDTSSPVSGAITAEQLLKEFEANEAASTTKYKDKVIIVSGIVTEIGPGNATYVTLTGGNRAYNYYTLFTGNRSGVLCIFAANDKSRLVQLMEGQFLIVEGRYKEFNGDIILENCSIK